MSASIAVIYSGELDEVARAFADAAKRLSARLRVCPWAAALGAAASAVIGTPS